MSEGHKKYAHAFDEVLRSVGDKRASQAPEPATRSNDGSTVFTIKIDAPRKAPSLDASMRKTRSPGTASSGGP